MPTITSYLAVEHALFTVLFDQIERVAGEAESAGEVNRLARVVEGVLDLHGHLETDLAFNALDHQLQEGGLLGRLHQEHTEIDSHLLRAKRASDLGEALRELKAAFQTSRMHFRNEERSVFPLFEKVFGQKSLEALGDYTLKRQLAPEAR